MQYNGFEPVSACNDGTREILARLLEATPEGDGPSAIHAEQLLVLQGWLWLRAHVVGSRHEVAVCTSKQGSPAALRLTSREFQVASLAAKGLMAKHIGFELSMREATVRGALSRSLQKLGLVSGARLPAIWRAMGGPGRRFDLDQGRMAFVFSCELAPRNIPMELTSAERSILASMVDGSSNRAISEQRGTSVSTIANQIAVILRKFRVSTRRELSAKILELEHVPR